MKFRVTWAVENVRAPFETSAVFAGPSRARAIARARATVEAPARFRLMDAVPVGPALHHARPAAIRRAVWLGAFT